jgi:hypothetical protein
MYFFSKYRVANLKRETLPIVILPAHMISNYVAYDQRFSGKLSGCNC